VVVGGIKRDGVLEGPRLGSDSPLGRFA
jgi:hypothetical protein